MAADRTPNELADRLSVEHQHPSPSGKIGLCQCPQCPDLRAAAALLREQAEQLDIQTALATNYAGKAVEYKQEKERAEEQLDSLRNAIREHRESALCNGSMFVADRERDLWDALDALAAAGGGVPEEGA